MLKDKNIVITGSNRGIGFAVLKACIENGANVFACMRSRSEEFETKLQILSEKYEVKIHPVYFDLKDERAVKEGASGILKYKAPISGIVNNAGVIGAKSLFSMTSMEEIRHTFEINFFICLFTAILLIPSFSPMYSPLKYSFESTSSPNILSIVFSKLQYLSASIYQIVIKTAIRHKSKKFLTVLYCH